MSAVLTARPATKTHSVRVSVVPAPGRPMILVEHPKNRPDKLVVRAGDRVTWDFRNYTARDMDLGITNFRWNEEFGRADEVRDLEPFRPDERLEVGVGKDGGHGQFSARAVNTVGEPRSYRYDIVTGTSVLTDAEVEIKA